LKGDALCLTNRWTWQEKLCSFPQRSLQNRR